MSEEQKNPQTEGEEIQLLEENQNNDIQQSEVENPEIAELKEALARSKADYQNLRMRMERDQSEMIYFLTEKLISPLLTQLDHLDRAVKIKDGVKGDTFVDGVRTVQTGLKKYLENQKIIAFDSIGQEVDPDKHEVLSQMQGPEGIIVQEFEKGYTLDGRVLRHAKVVVGNGEQ